MRHDTKLEVNFTDLKAAVEARIRASHGDLDYRGRQSFYAFVNMSKNPNREHGLRYHFKPRTCAHELVGVLEKMADLREDRFVFASLEWLQLQCFKGDRAKGKNFSRREFFRALNLSRALGIVSPFLRRDGHDGLIVAPHEALCVHTGKECRFIGPTFINRRKLGLAGRFTMGGDGTWTWFSGEGTWEPQL